MAALFRGTFSSRCLAAGLVSFAHSTACGVPLARPSEGSETIFWPLAPGESLLARLGERVKIEGPLVLVGSSETRTWLFEAGQRRSADRGMEAALLQVNTHEPAVLPRLGSRVASLRGVVGVKQGQPRLNVVGWPQWETSPRPGPPQLGEDQRSVGALNVQNYFTTLGSRGATTEEERQAQALRIATSLTLLPVDIWALTELEEGRTALASLREAVERQGGPRGIRYEAVLSAGCERGDSISAGLLYRPDRVREVGSPQWLSNREFRRCPLVQSFEVAGEILKLVVVHLTSKRCASGQTLDEGTSAQSPTACGHAERVAEARVLREWLAQQRQLEPFVEILVLGDFNSEPGELALDDLAEAGLHDLLESVPRSERYTYVFEGRASQLDGIWASPRLATRRQRAGIWHINADEPRSRRSSDHDPIWVSFTNL